MAVEIDIKELEKMINEAVSRTKSGHIQNKALKKGAEKIQSELKQSFGKFVGTKYSKGYTRDEIVRSNARNNKNGRYIEVGWNGPHERYRLIHLNEWGYTRNGKRYKPRMMGTVQKTLDRTEKEYYRIVGEELKKGYDSRK